MDPHDQRGLLVSGQRPPEMNLQPPDKDSNLGQLGTHTLMNQFYPGSKKVDPVYDVNNLPIPDKSYHHQPEPVHDKLVINTDVMLPRAVKGSRSDDVLIQLTHEQNGTARIFSSSSPGLLDIHHAQSPMNSPDNTHMMDYGMFDLGPDQDEIIHRVQFSDSNFAPPASGEHPIENDLAMETQGEASHDAHGDALESDPERPTYANAQNQLDHNADSLPIAPAQFAHGAGQFDDHADFYDEPQQMLPLGNKFRADHDVSWHEGQLHVEQTLQTSGQTYSSGQYVPNTDASYVVEARDQPIGCQPANLANILPTRNARRDLGAQDNSEFFYPQMELHQQAESQQHHRNGAPAVPQSYDGDRMVYAGAAGHSFRAAQGGTRHADLLSLEQPPKQCGQAYNPAQRVSNTDAAHFTSVQHRLEPAETTVGEFCQRRMGIQPRAEWQDGALRDEAPQSSGNHFYQEKSWDQPTIGDRQIGHESMGSLSYEQSDYYSHMDRGDQQAERQQNDLNGPPAFPQAYNRIGMVQGGAVEDTFRDGPDCTGHEGQHMEQTLKTSGQTYNFAQNSDASPVVWGPGQQMGCQPGNPAEVLPISDAPHDSGACYPRRFTPSGTAVTWNHQIANDRITGRPGNCRLDFQRIKTNTRFASLSDHTDDQISSSEESGVYSHPSTPDQTTTDGSSNGLHPPIFTYEGAESGSYQKNSGVVEAADNLTGEPRNCHLDSQRIKENTRSASSSSEESGIYSFPSTPDQTTTDSSTNGLHPPILTYEGAESGSYQINSGIVEAADNITGGPRNCRLDFQRIKKTTRNASLSDHTDDQISSSEESGFYSSPSTPDQTTTDGSTNGLLPPIVTNEEPPLNQLFLPNFTLQSRDHIAFQQAQSDIFMDYLDEELERIGNNGFLLIDNNDNVGFDVDRLCETYEYYARGMDNMLPLDILSNNEVEHFSLTGFLMSGNNEGSTSSSSSWMPEKKKRIRRSGPKMTPEEKKAHKKEANRKYSTISRDKKKSERDITKRIWEYIQNEIQIQQAAIKDVENNVEFANELLELTGQSSDLHGVLQQESQVYMYWKGEISRVSDIRRDEDTKVQDALLKKQSAKEKFEKSGEEYKSKEGGKKTTTIGSQKTRALQNHELVKAQYHILVNRHDLRREKFLKGLADLYFRRTVSRYIQRIWVIPVEVHQLLNQEQKLHQLDELRNFLQANRHLLKAPS